MRLKVIVFICILFFPFVSWGADLTIKKGATSNLVDVLIYDASSGAGAGLTGLVYNSSGLVCYYHRNSSATATSITLVTMTIGTWASGGFVAIDGTNMPGWYQIGIPDTALATGAVSTSIHCKGATNMVPLPIAISLVDNIEADTYAKVSGLTYTVANKIDANTLAIGGTTQTARDLGASVLLSSGTGTGQVSLSSGAVLLQPTQTGVTIPTVTNVGTVTGNVNGSVASVTGLTASNLDTTVSSRMATYTQPTGFLAATFPTGTIANTTNITAGTVTTATNLTNLPAIPANWLTAAGTAADFTTEIQTGLATPTNITAGTIATVGTVTNGVTLANDAITPASIIDGAITPAKEYIIAGTEGAGTSTTLKVYTALGVTGARTYNNMCLYSASNGERSRILSTGNGYFNVRGFGTAPVDTTVLRIYSDGCL